MPQTSSKILGNSVSALAAQQALIANISNNIANVNTPGFTRRQVDLQSRAEGGNSSGIQIGSGVEVGEVRRLANNYLESLMRVAGSDKGAAEVRDAYLGRMQALFGIKETDITIGSSLNEFFSAINQLSATPGNLDLRLNVIQRGEDLVSSIKTAYNTVAKLQTEADNRIKEEVDFINSYSTQIATLNGLIGAREVSGGVAADERDQRDVLLNQLAEKISFSTVETSNGAVSITLENGFPLVSGVTGRSLEATNSPTFATSTPPSLEGGALSYIVFNYGTEATPSHLDLTSVIGAGKGSVGGLLALRGIPSSSQTSSFQAQGDLVTVASRIEALTRALLTTVNTTYRGADEDSGTAGFQPNAGDLNGNAPGVFGLFDYTFSGVKDVNGNGLADLADLTTLDNYSSKLTFAVVNPQDFAAARDNNTTAGATNFSSGDAQNAQALVALRSATISFSAGNYSFTGTFEEQYNTTVSFVGNTKAAAASELGVTSANYASAANKRDSFSAVNLDEEFTSLIKFQKAFQASAKMIRTATDLLDTIVGLL
jgi:flagellar hook-associated protein 1 FlgK